MGVCLVTFSWLPAGHGYLAAKSHETIVRTLRDANRKLRQDNDQLRNELAVALGQLRDLRRGLPA